MHPSHSVSRLVAVAAALTAVAWLAVPLPAAGDDPPFEVTEKDRPRCASYEKHRQPLFGTTHLHTGLSFDASIRFVDYHSGNNPRGAYKFAKGESRIQLPDPQGRQLGMADPYRYPETDQALDWGAVTDHSEHFGEMGFCKDLMKEPVPERFSMECRMINGFFYQPGHAPNPGLGRNIASNAFTNLTLTSLGTASYNTHLPVCENHPEKCRQSELAVWDEVQLAAEENYDRSRDCSFTTFIAYENTSTPLLNNWHRNVIFRNDRVVKRPVNAIDMAVRVNPDPIKDPINSLGGIVSADDVDAARRILPAPPGTYSHPLPQPFWNQLEADCTFGKNVTDGKATHCDFITIPHNSNLGGGDGFIPPMFLSPYNAEDAKRHAAMEPLVEIYQDKGSSECRYDPRYLAGTDTIDEFCAFEILDGKTLGSASGVGSGSDAVAAPDTWGDRSYVRNVWKDGIQYAAGDGDVDTDGVNPFKMGVVAASDSHTGVMGWHPEDERWPGHLGIDDAYPMQRSSTIQNSSGGHSVVWAEENSRDSIFAALKRKETYGTSGTRPIVRFFGGWDFPEDACGQDFVELGYEYGVPMGGDLAPHPGGHRAPRFVAAAWRDDVVKTNLQQIQIIKGWVGKDGETKERVYSVAGDPGHPLNAQAAIDPGTCKAREDLGHVRLCAVWEDPYFDPEQHAFYYVRVLEEPVCRYSTLWCRNRIGVDPLDTAKCSEKLTAMASGKLGATEEERIENTLKAEHGAMCCSDQTSTPFIQPVIQERAWTSPIWYEPSAAEAPAADAAP
jgi:Protein of unknown function (DUF3604)